MLSDMDSECKMVLLQQSFSCRMQSVCSVVHALTILHIRRVYAAR